VAKCNQKPRPVQFLGQPVLCTETAWYHWWPLIHSLPGLHASNRSEEKQLKALKWLTPSLTEEAVCPSETVSCPTSSSSVRW
jgi:hypothetical protein